MIDRDVLLEELEEELKIRQARENYLEYVAYTNPDYIKSKFHTFLCNKVQEFIEKPTDKAFEVLLLSVPPQHGKSLTVTETLPSWYMGKNPRHNVIIASYNEDFATKFGRRNREKIQDFHHKLFPECELAVAPNNNTEFETTMKGGCISRGLMSGIAGNRANLIVIDDVVKNKQEADSPRTRQSQWDEYLAVVRTRLAPGAKLIAIGTRWHEEDLIGMLEKNEHNITVINIPCECDDPDKDPLGRQKGDALCPEIGKGNAWLKDYKKIYISKEGSRTWHALFQGRPVALEGNIIKREWWQYYEHMNIDEFPYVILSVDAAFKAEEKNDYVAVEVWGKINNNYYFIDGIRERLTFTETLHSIRHFVKLYPSIMFKLIEDKANGSAIIDILTKEMDGVIPVNPEGGKVARINAISPAIEDGRVFLPKFHPFSKILVEEAATFPAGASDDAIDCAAQALNRMIYVDADVVAPAKIRYTEWREDMWEDFENATEDIKVHLLDIWGHPMEFKE